MKIQLHNAPLEHCYACLGTADYIRAQWKALTRRARRGKNAEAFLNFLLFVLDRQKLCAIIHIN